MFDILRDSTIDIYRAALKTANNGYCPEDLLTGGTSTMLNIEKGQIHSHTLHVKSHFHEAKPSSTISSLDFRFQARGAGKSVMREIPSVFVPGTIPQLPNTPVTTSVKALGKLIAYGEANQEDSASTVEVLKGLFGADFNASKITPVTDPSRTKPWALEDAPRSRHINGAYNVQQNVSVSLGNYQTGVNTGGKLIDYDRVATLLRSIGVLIYGYEGWASAHIKRGQIVLNFHLNLGEFPNADKSQFFTPAISHILANYLMPDTVAGSAKAAQYRALIEDVMSARHMMHRVPATVLDPAIRMAVAELLMARKPQRILGPALLAETERDVSLPTQSLSSFSVLPKPASDKKARTPRNATFRLLVPWLKVLLGKEEWPHTIAHLMKVDKQLEAAMLLTDHLDPRIPRLAYAIVQRHTPVAQNTWRILLRWLFLNAEAIPAIVIHDPASAYFASIKVNRAVLLGVFTSAYFSALQMRSHFDKLDILVTTDTRALESIYQIRRSLYTRVASAYARRYMAKAHLIVAEIKDIDTQYPKRWRARMTSGLRAHRANLVKSLTKLQWRAKAYPALVPTTEDGHGYDEGRYMTLLYGTLLNYCKKRRMTGPEAFVQGHINDPNQWTLPLREKLAALSRMFKLNLVEALDDILTRRAMTLDDIDNFITYDTALRLHADDLLIQDEMMDVRAPHRLDTAEMRDNFYAQSSEDEDDAEADPTGWGHGGWEHESSDGPDAAGGGEFSAEAQLAAMFAPGQLFGMEAVRPVDALYWDQELQDAGYSYYWIAKAADHLHLTVGDTTTRAEYEAALRYVQGIWKPRPSRNPALALAETADIG